MGHCGNQKVLEGRGDLIRKGSRGRACLDCQKKGQIKKGWFAGKGDLREQRAERGSECAGLTQWRAVTRGCRRQDTGAGEAGETGGRGNGACMPLRKPGVYPVGVIKPLKVFCYFF